MCDPFTITASTVAFSLWSKGGKSIYYILYDFLCINDYSSVSVEATKAGLPKLGESEAVAFTKRSSRGRGRYYYSRQYCAGGFEEKLE